MGLTICYSGSLRNPDDLEALLDDVSDICIEIGWNYMPFHRSNIMPTEGFMITPDRSEPIWLTFLPNGILYDPSHFIYTTRPELETVNENKRKWIFTKTQYAGVDTHMAIIKFFRYLHLKYFEVFELHDQSGYWETDDASVCLIRFDEFNDGMEKLSGMLQELEFEDESNVESEAERMDRALLSRGGLGISMN